MKKYGHTDLLFRFIFSIVLIVIFANCTGKPDGSNSGNANTKPASPSIETPSEGAPAKIDKENSDTPDKTEKSSPKPNAPTVTTTTSSKPRQSPEELVRNLPPLVVPPRKDSKEVKEKVNLLKGKMAHYIPDTLLVDKPVSASLTISDSIVAAAKLQGKTAANASLFGKKINPELVDVQEVQISDRMKARLSSPQGTEYFEITPDVMTERTLHAENNNTAFWQWTIIAKQPGFHSLLMEIEATFQNEKGEVTQNIPVFSEEIYVESSIPDYSMFWYTGAGIFIIGLLVFIFMKRTKLPVLNNEDIEKIEQLIANGETETALKTLQKQKKISSVNENLLISHLAEFNEIRRQYNAGTIERADMQMVVNRINGSLLNICDELK